MSIKQIAAIRRKPGLTRAEFASYLRNVHGELAAAQPLGVDRYVQNHVFDGAYGTASDSAYTGVSSRDLITELWFADATAMQRTFADPYSQTTLRSDGKKFNDFSTATGAITREETLTACLRDAGSYKVFYYIKSAGAGGADVAAGIRSAHAGFMMTAHDARLIEECVMSVPVSQATNAQHFGGTDAPAFDAIVMLRFANEADLAIFRPYQRHAEATGLIDASGSFFVFAREIVIFDVVRGQPFVAADAVLS